MTLDYILVAMGSHQWKTAVEWQIILSSERISFADSMGYGLRDLEDKTGGRESM